MDKLLIRYLEYKKLTSHQIDSYNDWLNTLRKYGISEPIVLKNGIIVSFENLNIYSPRWKNKYLTPKLAREQGITYASEFYIDVVIKTPTKNGNYTEFVEKNLLLAKIPTMIGSEYCILKNKTPRELELYGEDPNDIGGYFIISGNEKLILLREQMLLGKIYIVKTKENKNYPSARLTIMNRPKSTSSMLMVLDNKTYSILKLKVCSNCLKEENKLENIGKYKYKKNNIDLVSQEEKDKSLNTKTKKKKRNTAKGLNILIFFNLFGVTDVEDMKKYISKFIKKERINKSINILNRTIIDYLNNNNIHKIFEKKMKRSLTDEEFNNEVITIKNNFFPNNDSLPTINGETVEHKEKRIIQAKLNMFSIMIGKLLQNLAGFIPFDDTDSWSNKSVRGAGKMIEKLFNSAFRQLTSFRNEKNLDDVNASYIISELKKTELKKNEIITTSFQNSFTTGNWGIKKAEPEEGVSQPLKRYNIIDTYSLLNNIDVGIFRNDRQINLRLVQNSQWGFIDPVSSSEGKNAGLVKNICLTTNVTLENDDSVILRYIYGEDKISSLVHDDESDEHKDKLIINSKFLGFCNGNLVKKLFINYRRQRMIPEDTSVVKENDWLYINTGPSRLIRPLLIVDEDQQLLIEKLNLVNAPIPELISKGVMEFITPWEQEYLKICSSPKLLNKNTNYTHCEIDPQAILGVASSIIPWPNHNQAPRNTYQLGMGKQALGTYHANYLNRYDTSSGSNKNLDFPERPMLDTQIYDVVGLNEKGSGQNVSVAFMAYPFTEEDAFVFKKEFLDNGGFRYTKYFVVTAIVKHSGDIREKLTKPPVNKDISHRFRWIRDSNSESPGLPMIGAHLIKNDCIIGKIRENTLNNQIIDSSVYLKFGEEGVVDNILVTTDYKEITIRVKIRITRVPQEGDKFAPRNAQKGTIGLILGEEDLPSSTEGITPDIIVNPHSIPSRMTMSYIMELLAAKSAAFKGERIDAGAFMPFNMNEYRKIIKSRGLNEFGYEKVRSGNTGKHLETDIYFGPVFFQALKHHVKDKYQARNNGTIQLISHQPSKGRGNKGGLRFGEMERDAAISHGASSFLRERLMLVSDKYQTVFCKNCGIFAVNDPDTDGYKPCRLCEQSSFGRCTIPYIYKLLMHYLAALGINLRPVFLNSEEYLNKVLNIKNEITDVIETDLQNEESKDYEEDEINEDEIDEDEIDEDENDNDFE